MKPDTRERRIPATVIAMAVLVVIATGIIVFTVMGSQETDHPLLAGTGIRANPATPAPARIIPTATPQTVITNTSKEASFGIREGYTATNNIPSGSSPADRSFGKETPGGNLSPPSVIMQGDTITISGTAQGNPVPGIAIWIIGAPGAGTAGYADQVIVHPDPAGSYSLELDRATARLEEGRFHVIVQHPMQNKVFDISLANVTAGDARDGWVLNRMLSDTGNAGGTRVFKIRGSGCLQGDDAYGALIQVFNDPAVDDTIAIFPSDVNPAGSGDTVPVQQTREPEPQNL